MIFSRLLALSAVAQAVLAAQFKVVAPEGKSVQVSINGVSTNLSAPDPDVAYFVGEANASPNSQYKYIVDGKEETFVRTLTGSSTRNDIFLRKVTYGNIPALPTVIGVNDWKNAIAPGDIWDANYLPSVFVTADPGDITSLVTHLSKSIYKAKITYITADQVYTFEGADFQLHKPGKPHNNAKQSWKWKLPKNLNGRNFFKIRHMEEDPTQIREKLCADILRAMGVYAPQANMIRFFINGKGFGTFNMLDDIPTYSYIQAVFYGGNPPAKMGPLYDGASGASFDINKKDMLSAFMKVEKFVDDKNLIKDVSSKLADLNVEDDQAVEEFSHYFQVDQFLRFMVLEFLVAHWDGYWQQQTNIGTYEDKDKKMLYFLGQDFDGTFGVNMPQDRSFLDVPYTDYPEKFKGAVMINKLLENDKIKATFESYLKSTVTKVFNNNTLTARVLAIHDFILPDLKWDRNIKQQSKGIDYHWTFAETTENLEEAVSSPTDTGGGAEMGLIEYIIKKSEAVAKQLNLQL